MVKLFSGIIAISPEIGSRSIGKNEWQAVAKKLKPLGSLLWTCLYFRFTIQRQNPKPKPAMNNVDAETVLTNLSA